MKTDLTNQSEQELSLLVFNEAALYHDRHTRGFIDWLSELFIFTEEQAEVLKQDLRADKNDLDEEES